MPIINQGPETDSIAVTMELSKADLDNLDFLVEQLRSECGAQAISKSLDLIRQLLEVKGQNRLLIELDSGVTKELQFGKFSKGA